MPPWMIYGANGYTGRLIADEARRRGLCPILAGRNAEQITALGAQLGCETRIFALTDAATVAAHLGGVDAVLHCAGPFSATSRPMLSACLQARTHYLDITGEIAVLEETLGRADECRQAGIVALPAVGFDVVPSDCLAAMLKRALPDATHLCLAFMTRPGTMSPGTAKSTVEGIRTGGKVRRNGRIVTVPFAHKVRQITFAAEPRTAVTIPWGDVSTAYHSTGIPNIEVYIAVSPAQVKWLQLPEAARWLLGSAPAQALLKGLAARLVKGPEETARAGGETLLWGEATNAAGRTAVIRLRTPEGYAFTVDAALASIAALFERTPAPGAYTPSLAFGPDFVLGLSGVVCRDDAQDETVLGKRVHNGGQEREGHVHDHVADDQPA